MHGIYAYAHFDDLDLDARSHGLAKVKIREILSVFIEAKIQVNGSSAKSDEGKLLSLAGNIVYLSHPSYTACQCQIAA